MSKKEIEKSIEKDSPDFIIPIGEIEIEGTPIFTSKLEGFDDKIQNTKSEEYTEKILEINTQSSSNVPDCIQDVKEEKKDDEENTLVVENNDSGDSPVSSGSKKRNIIVAMLATASIGAVGVTGYDIYKDIEAEQIRLSELDKESLDLKLIINTVDDYGNGEYQLNWKEVASILGVETSNRPSEISKSDIERVCSLFLDKEKNKVKDLKDVVATLEIKDKEKERIFNYNEDLLEYGYMPERLISTSPQIQFINSIKPGAIDSYKKTGILPSVTIAQAILESSWGESNLSKESNNLFGIKADSSWKGDFVVFETKEFHDTMIEDKFRKYPTVNDSIVDHSEFLRLNPRYEEGGVFNAKTYKEQVLALQESGYSTAEDENGNKIYASMLEQIIRQYNLQILDWEVKK